jgi:ABC-2 type transport system permease protein
MRALWNQDRRTLIANLHAVRMAFEMTLRQMATDMFVIFAVVVQPLVIAFIGLWMLRGARDNYAIYVVIGSGMSGLWTSMVFVGSNAINQERWTRTLEPIVAAPTPLSVVIFGKNLANVTQWLGSMTFSYALISTLLGYPLTIHQPLLAILSLGLTMVAFVTFGLIMATIFVVNPEFMQWRNGLEYPIFLLSGFLFPIALLPGWTTPLSYVLAPYWAARILHNTTSGHADVGELALCWGMLLAFSTIYLLLSARLFKIAMYKVRVAGTLSQY